MPTSDEELVVVTPAPSPNGHTSLVECLYHQLPNEQPVMFEARWEHWLGSDESPWDRELRGKNAVGETWQPLDFGWLNDPGLVLIENKGGDSLGVVLTAEQQAEEDARVLVVGWQVREDHTEAIELIPPGKTTRYLPTDASKLRIRCRAGKTRVRIVAHPR